MIQSEFKGIKVAGIMTAVPPKKTVIAKKYGPIFGEEEVEQFINSTGVRERYSTSKKQTASDLAFVAARELIKEKKIDVKEVGVLIFVTQSADYLVPSTACVLHKRLGLSKDCIAYDINLGCSGYVYGMQTACALMQSVNCKYALLLVGDTSNKSRIGKPSQDKSSAMLFGEGGSATLLENKKKVKTPIKTMLRTDGEGFKAIIVPAGGCRMPKGDKKRTVWPIDGNVRSDYDGYMNGMDVFSFTITEVPKMLKEYMASQGTGAEDYDSFVLHQANCYVLKQISKRCKLPEDKMPISMDRYGNTSVTSIPLTICDRYGKEEEEKELRLFTYGFGIGLSWGIADMTVNTKDIYPIIKTGEYYTEGGVSHD